MAFIDDDTKESLITENQKVRFKLSKHAQLTMEEDMFIFSVQHKATFINTVFNNYKDDAKASIENYLAQMREELYNVLSQDRYEDDFKVDLKEKLSEKNKQLAIDYITENERELLSNQLSEQLKKRDGESKLYHINNQNTKFLNGESSEGDCLENNYYKSPGQYIRAVVEEYCSLPFVERERIYRKDCYDIVEQGCRERKAFNTTVNINGVNQTFNVRPYKIITDSLNSQAYLACYSKKKDDDSDNYRVATFSMARLETPTRLYSTPFHLNATERKEIEKQITEYPAAYLVGTPEEIKVRLTDNGVKSYHARIHTRPEKIQDISDDNVYTFNCTQQQAFNYFFSFGPDAEIISPESLRNKFINTYKNSLKNYK